MSGASTHAWIRALITVGIIGTLGCGNGCSKADPPAEPPPPTGASTAPSGATAEPAEVGLTPVDNEAAPLLPVLNADALSARVEAQRAVLGDRAVLFEDQTGRPVPWISQGGGLEDAIDDSLLDSLPGSSGLGVTAVSGPAVNGNALGLFTPLAPGVEGGPPPLEHFYAALRTLEAGKDADGKVRILAYGASHTDADIYPHYLRSYLQQRFGDGGHGFVHIARPWNWYGHVDMQVSGVKRWSTAHAQRKKGIEDGMFGLMGASLTATSRKAFGKVSPRSDAVASQYEIYFLAQPRGGSFKVFADGKLHATVKTRAKVPSAGYYAFSLPEGQHEIEIQVVGNGPIRMFGMTAERAQPGIVVDTLGIGGTRAANMLGWDEAVWADNVSHRAPDLIMLAYGTNEATDTHADIAVYAADQRAVMDKLRRIAPQASCLIISGGDFPRRIDDGTFRVRPRVAKIRETQREVAREYGCAFWNLHQFMGGDLSMTRWARAQPAMAKSDHLHFTKRGYTRMGMGLVDAIMVPFDGDSLTH